MGNDDRDGLRVSRSYRPLAHAMGRITSVPETHERITGQPEVAQTLLTAADHTVGDNGGMVLMNHAEGQGGIHDRVAAPTRLGDHPIVPIWPTHGEWR